MSTRDLPDFIFFDANPLIEEGWPKIRGSFEKVISLSAKFGIQLAIPEVFKSEVRKHFEERTFSAISSVERIADSLSHLKRNVEVPKLDYFMSEYDKGVESFFKEYNFIIVPLPDVSLERLVNLAIAKHPPFGEQDKGFRDTVGLLAILEFIQKEGNNKLNYLVSRDSGLLDTKVQELISGYSVNLEVIASLDTLEERLKGYLNYQEKQALEEEERLAKEALISEIPQIEKYLRDRYVHTPTYSDIYAGIALGGALNDIKVKEIINASVAHLDSNGKVTISFNMRCKLKFKQKRVTISSETTSSIGVPGLTGSILDFIKKEPTIDLQDKILEEEYSGEAIASREEGKYTDISIRSITKVEVLRIFTQW